MKSILVSPKNKAEFEMLKAFLNKFGLRNADLTTEQVEDLGLAIFMAEVDRDEKVPEEDVLKLLDYEG
jgi:hypothetical protein